MRLRGVLAATVLLVVGLGGMAGLAGCAKPGAKAQVNAAHGDPAGAGTETTATPTHLPAAFAGGACQLLDYTVIKSAIGIDFDVAAASESAGTATCVAEKVGASLPDLTLSVTPSKISADVFTSSVAPKGATTAGGLGKKAYWAPVAAAGTAGPGIEVGWLSANQRLMVLRLRTPTGTAAGEVTPLASKLVGLAKLVDKATG